MTAMVAGISTAAVEREAAMMEASDNFIWARKLRALRAALDKAEAERDRLREALERISRFTHISPWGHETQSYEANIARAALKGETA